MIGIERMDRIFNSLFSFLHSKSKITKKSISTGTHYKVTLKIIIYVSTIGEFSFGSSFGASKSVSHGDKQRSTRRKGKKNCGKIENVRAILPGYVNREFSSFLFHLLFYFTFFLPRTRYVTYKRYIFE